MDSTYQNSLSSCLGRTCLKWGSDGELSPPDLKLVMQRLALVDEEVAALNLLTSATPARVLRRLRSRILVLGRSRPFFRFA